MNVLEHSTQTSFNRKHVTFNSLQTHQFVFQSLRCIHHLVQFGIHIKIHPLTSHKMENNKYINFQVMLYTCNSSNFLSSYAAVTHWAKWCTINAKQCDDLESVPGTDFPVCTVRHLVGITIFISHQDIATYALVCFILRNI